MASVIAATTRGHRQGGTSEAGNRHKAVRFAGGSINIPALELCCVWTMLQEGHIRPLDARTWLACLEVRERRKFAGRGRTPAYEVAEVAALIGGTEIGARASIRRLQRAGLVRWTSSGPSFVESPENLAVVDVSSVLEMAALMPARRRSFPMPRRMLRLLAGGVKRSVLATVFGHLLRCPHYTKTKGWDPVGACKASWVAEAFGVSERSVKRARAHLVHELRWLMPEEAEQWYLNRNGGRFGVRLDWTGEARPSVGEGRGCSEFSTAELSPPQGGTGTRLSPPESKQPSPSEIQKSTPGAERPRPPVESSTKKVGEGCPQLTRIRPEDLRSVPRVMELFDQALTSKAWRARGWTPTDGYLERLNWAAAARRASVRGSINPCGVFVHLVSKRKWDHISNDDEEAVRRELAIWKNPEPETTECDQSRGRTQTSRPLSLSKDGKTLRFVEATLRRHRVEASVRRVDRELSERGGWSSDRIAAAREELENWKRKDQRKQEWDEVLSV